MIHVDNYIMDRNRLIGHFMGLGVQLHMIEHPDTGEYIDLKDVKYHKEWNWLMPVVEKIETTEYILPEKYKRGFLKNATTCYIEIDTLYDPREEFKGWTGSVLFVHGNPIFDPGTRFKSKIEATWNAVVGFITWFNEQIK